MYMFLKKARRARGITQDDMSALLGYDTRNAYALKERGLRKFDVQDAIKVAKVLGIPVEKLFSDG